MTYKDIADETEDERIRQIGSAAMKRKQVSFVTDSEPGKADRYIEKLKAGFPGISVVSRGEGPVPDTVYVIVALAEVIQ